MEINIRSFIPGGYDPGSSCVHIYLKETVFITVKTGKPTCPTVGHDYVICGTVTIYNQQTKDKIQNPDPKTCK